MEVERAAPEAGAKDKQAHAMLAASCHRVRYRTAANGYKSVPPIIELRAAHAGER
jgi:hypothetical protein